MLTENGRNTMLTIEMAFEMITDGLIHVKPMIASRQGIAKYQRITSRDMLVSSGANEDKDGTHRS